MTTVVDLIHPIILSGGSGTRLWPLSRKGFPKQFTRLVGDRSLFAASAARLAGEGFGPPVVVTGSDFRFVVTEQLLAEGIDPGAVLIEPDGRNTAPAVLAAALHVAASDPDALMLVAPSDHAIADPAAFRAMVQRGVAAARAGQIVTFGIAPTRAAQLRHLDAEIRRFRALGLNDFNWLGSQVAKVV